MSEKYASFTKEFKLETLRLADETELPISQFARNLGIRRNLIYKWRTEMKKKHDKAFKGTPSQNDSNQGVDTMADLTAENKHLKKALKLSQMETEILKKSGAYFKNLKS